jgi:hypothetical protein
MKQALVSIPPFLLFIAVSVFFKTCFENCQEILLKMQEIKTNNTFLAIRTVCEW